MKIIFAGTPEFSVSVLDALIAHGHEICAVYTQPDRPKGRGRKLMVSAVKDKALLHELPVYQPKSLRTQEAQLQMASHEADIMVVVAYGLILPQAILDTPKLGCLNVHASLLPDYRGASPIQAAILNGDKESGVTIMKMDIGLDTGDMLLKKYCPIGVNDTSAHLHDALSSLGALGIVEALKSLENNTATFEKQNDDLASYAGKINKVDALIDWTLSSQQIHNAVRAYHGWPVSYSHLNGNIVRVWQTELVDIGSSNPGEIIDVTKNHLIISCGSGALSIKKIQLPNSKPMNIKDCLNSKRALFSVGDIFNQDAF